MRTVRLEILRRGPAHGQLLSPLTEYLGLCGNRDAETLQVPFEHRRLRTYLNALDYKDSAETRELQIEDIALELGDMLGGLRGLVAELSDGPDEEDNLIHLRLILSASELALLPFEAARSAPGMPGSGQHLLLQTDVPIVLTREVRRVPDRRLDWPDRMKILFVASAAGGDIPIEGHSLALRKIIEPWVRYFDKTGKKRARVEDHLTILPQADITQVAAEIAKGGYTHVHFLAHGDTYREAGEDRFGLVFYDARDPGKRDVVRGARLAAALNAVPPTVVTLATCHGGAGGGVIGPGGSVAHALHQAGIPLVVASQFPLTFTASITMVETLYPGLLAGDDPRKLLYRLREELKSRIPNYHDWASLVAYASLPDRLDDKLFDVKLSRLRQRVNAAMNDAGRLSQLKRDELDRFRARMDEVRDAVGEIHPKAAAERLRRDGLIASLEKRKAQVLLANQRRRKQGDPFNADAREALAAARDFYWEAYKSNHASTWAIVQYLVLATLLAARQGEQVDRETWTAAHFLAQRDLQSTDPNERCWALGSLIELHLLAVLDPGVASLVKGNPADLAERYAEELNESEIRSEIYTTRQQIARYHGMFARAFDNERVSDLARKLERKLTRGTSYD
ncbi:MAG: CHAT domain-containing protein [Bryobacteraceae bacterium]